MRIEIRFKRTPYVGFNDALWFMGNNNRPWPKNGESDLVENPKKTLNDCAHFTLHSENHYAGVIGGGGSVTSSINLANMSQWNIYWLEWYPVDVHGRFSIFFPFGRNDSTRPSIRVRRDYKGENPPAPKYY